MRQQPMSATEAGHVCHHPGCCDHGDAMHEAASGSTRIEAAPPLQAAGAATWWRSLQSWWWWFLAFFGIYATSSVCGFCGTPGCPVGAGGGALVGGVFAGLWQYGAYA